MLQRDIDVPLGADGHIADAPEIDQQSFQRDRRAVFYARPIERAGF